MCNHIHKTISTMSVCYCITCVSSGKQVGLRFFVVNSWNLSSSTLRLKRDDEKVLWSWERDMRECCIGWLLDWRLMAVLRGKVLEGSKVSQSNMSRRRFGSVGQKVGGCAGGCCCVELLLSTWKSTLININMIRLF